MKFFLTIQEPLVYICDISSDCGVVFMIDTNDLYARYRKANNFLLRENDGFLINMPSLFRISLVEKCNSHCSLCYRESLSKERFSELDQEAFSVAVYKKLAQDAFPYADKVVIGLAGEPTLHPQFGEFLEITHSYGVYLEVYTNGLLLNRPSIVEPIVNFADCLTLSMDGATQDTLNITRGGASLHKIIQNVERLQDLKAALDRSNPLQLSFHITMRRSNVHELKQIVALAHDMGVTKISAAHAAIHDPKDRDESLFSMKERSDQCCADAIEQAIQFGITPDFPPLFRDSNYAEPNPHFDYCYQLAHEALIFGNGDVAACCHTAARFNMVMGNLKTENFPSIWYGRQYEYLWQSIQNKNYNPACKDCANNSTFISVNDDWTVEEYARSNTMNLRKRSILSLFQYNADLFEKQKRIYDRIVPLENRIDQELASLRRYELLFPQQYHLTNHIQSQITSRIHQFVVIAKHRKEGESLRSMNRALYERGSEFQGNYPLHLEVSIMAGCDIRCFMCSIAQLSEEENKELMKRRMSWETFQILERDLFPYAESIFFGIGGEAMLHPDFCKFVHCASTAGLKVNLTTNGMSLVSPKIAHVCVDHVNDLTLSIDGATPETFERIRVGARWDKLLKGIERLNALKEASNHSSLKLSINIALMRQNIEELPDLVELAHQWGVKRIMAEHFLSMAPELESQSLFSTPEKSDRYILEAIAVAEPYGIHMEVPDLFCKENTPEMKHGNIRNVRPIEREPEQPHCTLLNYSTVIYPSGMVTSCGHPDAMYLFPVGNVNEQPFHEIWFGERYQALRVSASKNKIPETCLNCSMSGRSDGGLPTHKRDDPRIEEQLKARSYSKRFMLRHIEFQSELIYRNSLLTHHRKTLEDIYQQIQIHRQNLISLRVKEPESRREKQMERLVQKILNVFNRIKKRIKNIMLDQNKSTAFASQIEWVTPPPDSVMKDSSFSFDVRVKNVGQEVWKDGASETDRSVMIGGGFYHENILIAHFGGWGQLPHPLKPAQTATVSIQSNTFSLPLGEMILRVECVQLGSGFFSEWGSPALEHKMSIIITSDSENLWQRGLRSCTNMWTPTEGFFQHENYTYPLFITKSDKARVYDLQNKEYLDYIIGWGTATLGYNHPEIQNAIRRWLSVGPTLPLTHPLQVEVAEKLSSILPCGERVLFGKNGSDVLEAAIRTARSYRAKDRVLCCGYHGFHDWFIGTVAGVKGVPRAVRELVEMFPYGDLEYLKNRLDRADDVAAIVIEPVFQNCEPTEYLQTIRMWTEERDIPLIFDEIMSAFRIANGGAQEKYGVIPDMVAVGKGIANGMPLAALAGKRKIMDYCFDVGYGPTFQGEVYSLAAASTAIDIYQREPVCQYITSIAIQLQNGFLEKARQHEIEVELHGVPTRQMVHFHEINGYSSAMIRTFFVQELLHRNILCAGHFLTCYAHTDDDISYTINTFDEVLAKLKKILMSKTLEQNIHIPVHQLFLGEKLDA